MYYVTPQHFRVLQTGNDLDNLEDSDLAFVLSRAAALTNAYCSVPNLPLPHDFRGGTVTGETHRWRVGNDVIEGDHRVYLWHRPIKAITDFRIYATNQQYLQVSPSEMFINPSEGYAEVSSLNVTPFGVFGSAILPIIGLQVPVSKTDYTYGWELPVVDEVFYPTDGTLFRGQHQWWTDDDVTVKLDGVTQSTGFTLDRDEGTVTFDNLPAAGAVVTVSYTHRLPHEICQAQAIIASSLLGERELVTLGMSQLESIEVEEVRLRRSIPQRTSTTQTSVIPEAARTLLDGYVFRTVR